MSPSFLCLSVAPNAESMSPGASCDTSLSISARKTLKVHGLVPPQPESYASQKARCLAQLARSQTNIDKYLYLSALRHRNVDLFYRILIDHFIELTPIIYTPVVGEACQRWCEIYQHPEGLYVSYRDKGRVADIVANWPQEEVEITVITDGSRILGLGDLGIGGMGIAIGKLALYTGCAGIRPDRVLPLTVDTGTNNATLRSNPLYLGDRSEKVSAEEEQELLDELLEALVRRWPRLVVQFEDWKNPFPSLARYGEKYAMFNDDVQGTGAVIMGGVIGAVKASGIAPRDHRAVFFGAGSAGVGVAQQIVEYFKTEGLSETEARKIFWFVDTKGLVTLDRGDKLPEHKVHFARDDNNGQQIGSLDEVIDHVRPTMLMGLSTIGGAFTPAIISKMGLWNQRPIIFPLSNPVSKSECTYGEAIVHTEGRVLFASGSPFDPITYRDKTYHPNQGNNMYVFPGIGLGTILCKASRVTGSMIYAAGQAVSARMSEGELEDGLLYPRLVRIREVSAFVALCVIRAAQKDAVDDEKSLREISDAQLEALIRAQMYDPHSV
ncbi:malic enzyme [Aspergillus pseudoustus]|uniref:Malic enzyme n=1 Tax=Aspergillus pseudoustus TaxID=1810923 RepID=A0ABR4JF42_9EURO